MVDLHRTQLSTNQILIEAAFLAILIVYFLFRKTISSTWTNFLRNISEKSKVVAAILPHALYFGLCLVLYFSLNEVLIPLTSARIMPVCTIVIPLLTTFRTLSFYDSSDPPAHYNIENNYSVERIDAFRHQILVWIELGLYHAFATILALLPFSSRVLAILPIVKFCFIISLVWVQISPNFAGVLFKFAIIHVLRKVAAIFPSGVGALEASAASKSRTMFGVMKMFGLINNRHEDFLISLFQDGLATLIAMMFIFMPNPMASVGMVGISLLVPAFRSSSTSSLVRSKSGARLQSTSTSTEESIVEYRKWLHYWICIAWLWILRMYGLQLWPSVMTISSLFLQHSYFQGATYACKFVGELSTALASRNSDIQLAAVEAAPPTLQGSDDEGNRAGSTDIASVDLTVVETASTATTSVPTPGPADSQVDVDSPLVDEPAAKKTPKRSAKNQQNNEKSDHKETYNTRRSKQKQTSDSKMAAAAAAETEAAAKNEEPNGAPSNRDIVGPFSVMRQPEAEE